MMATFAASWFCLDTALAALGGDKSSVLADAAAFHGTWSSQPLGRYEVQEIASDGGWRVHEYLNGAGQVFAVTWSGAVMPDLQRLLGAHFAAYANAYAALPRPGLQRSLRLASSDLVVEYAGHLRAYHGRAYLPALLPADLAAANLE